MQVDLVINSWERTYREVLRPGFFDSIADQNRFRFGRRIALINNVNDEAEALRLATKLQKGGEIDEVHRIDQRADHALRATGLTRRALGAGELHSLPSLVAVTLPGSDWVVHWDAEVALREPGDWISPALALMDSDPRVLVANPRWDSPKLESEVLERNGAWNLGHGISDHIYLGRRLQLGAPIYGERCVVRRRYPLAWRGFTFEARLDAYLRHHDRLRATHRNIAYVHDDAEAGASHPSLDPVETARQALNRAVITGVRVAPYRARCVRAMERTDPAAAAESAG